MTLALECRELIKGFGGIPVLKGVSLALEQGSVTALAGENGAGKSTLMKIASGQYRADSGSVLVGGTALTAGNMAEAHRSGVAIVPQELASIPDLTVYENLFVGRELRRAGFLDRRGMIKQARAAMDVFGVDIPVTARMASLPVGMQQIVEIVKATRTGAKVLLLDEPSSAIAEREVERLYGVVRRLREQGVAMIYTTHKMEEIRALADRVVVLRDGELVLDQSMGETTDDEIVTAMIGRELGTLFPTLPSPTDDVALEVSGLQVVGASAPVDLTVRKGEILGLAGLVGAGRTELMEAIFGVRRSTAGVIRIGDRQLPRGRPPAAIDAGMAMVPEDRKANGAVMGMSVLDNATIPRLGQFNVAGWLRGASRRSAVDKAMASVRLRSSGLGQEVGTLSGGNQQKVVLARWLTGPVSVLLLDEPTRGVDVGARSEIYKIITDLADSGVAVVMASSDMPEILGLAHRALVMRAGAVAGELDRADLDAPDVQATIFSLAAGLEADQPDPARPIDRQKVESSS
ncbi:sugar ABC transporter ATP-binding protein [Microlunatus soli]|uniref:Monosaccharide ABC transporter ATP-binding protein, CUT2 family n=1 Tax=Microlunatus soli TaxID=630515 RepID=A0A1H1UZD7_9ACTN|nr:sugar ABC transporter ATP-binding protein [Microlunatus soli]SDS77269.1 monosaccharide ABC transporter ATP-binding protein, CUT2 family [Microlunatus soli]